MEYLCKVIKVIFYHLGHVSLIYHFTNLVMIFLKLLVEFLENLAEDQTETVKSPAAPRSATPQGLPRRQATAVGLPRRQSLRRRDQRRRRVFLRRQYP